MNLTMNEEKMLKIENFFYGFGDDKVFTDKNFLE